MLRLSGAVLFRQNGDWQCQQRYQIVEGLSPIDTAQFDPRLNIPKKSPER